MAKWRRRPNCSGATTVSSANWPQAHSPDEAWRADIERIVQRLDEDCRQLSRSGSDLLRVELSSQLEHELMRSTNPAARSVLSVVLKRLDAV